MKLCDLLFEMPLKSISYHKYDNDGSFDEKDRKLIQKLIAKKEYHSKLKLLKNDLYIYLVDHEVLKRIAWAFPEGEVKKDGDVYFIQGFSKRFGDKYNNQQNIKNDKDASDWMQNLDFSPVFKQIEERLKHEPHSTHFIMGDNHAGNTGFHVTISAEDAKIGPTPWILIHRLVHALPKLPIWKDIEKYKFLETSDIASAFTFKSVKNKVKNKDDYTSGGHKVSNISSLELKIEIATQYLITGKIPLDIEAFEYEIKNRLGVFGGDVTIDEAKKVLFDFVDELKSTVDDIIEKIKGKIFYV